MLSRLSANIQDNPASSRVEGRGGRFREPRADIAFQRKPLFDGLELLHGSDVTLHGGSPMEAPTFPLSSAFRFSFPSFNSLRGASFPFTATLRIPQYS